MKQGRTNKIIRCLREPKHIYLLVWFLTLLIIFIIKCEIKALIFIPLAFLVITIIYLNMKDLIKRLEKTASKNKWENSSTNK